MDFIIANATQDITNKEALKRAEKRFNKAISQATPSASKLKR